MCSIMMSGSSSGAVHRRLDVILYSASSTAAANLDDAGGCPLSRCADPCTRPCPLNRNSRCSYAQFQRPVWLLWPTTASQGRRASALVAAGRLAVEAGRRLARVLTRRHCDTAARVAGGVSICEAQTWLHGEYFGRAVYGAEMFRTGLIYLVGIWRGILQTAIKSSIMRCLPPDD
jgi:hypothetical protein